MIAHAPVHKGAAVADDLERLAQYRSLRGIRRLIEGEADPSICLAPDFVDGLRLLPKHGLTFDICVKHWGLVFAIELARRCPEVQIVLDHIGKPGIKHGLVEPWQGQLRELARLPNVVCKLSGLVTEADPATWTPAALRPYVDHLVSSFGPERLLFGSDWPVVKLAASYSRWLETALELLAPLSPAERDAIFSGNARRVYRLS
jgi:L-fuconolactonase